MVDEQVKWPIIGMTLDEAAQALRVDPKTLRTLIKAGDFPARKVGKGYRIDWDAAKLWLASSTGQATDDE
ncbi:helix-turn-helix domain-containing protein [Desulfovibrio sp. OttesenSCG-928-G11]|nr:helix-turn-helix domain-containing protein [Desulfovibrio sp. OttesenSCG-928-G11]